MGNLGEIIKEGLYKKRINQAEFAKKIGKPSQVINDWIKGRRKPDIDTFTKILIELDCVGEVFPGYRKAESDLEKRIERLESLLVEQKQEKKVSKIENLVTEIVEEKREPLTA